MERQWWRRKVDGSGVQMLNVLFKWTCHSGGWKMRDDEWRVEGWRGETRGWRDCGKLVGRSDIREGGR